MKQQPAEQQSLHSDNGLQSARDRDRVFAAIICAVLIAPVVYLAWHVMPGRASTTVTKPVNGNDAISALEATARLQPTEDNQLNLSLAYINANRLSSAMPVLKTLVAEHPSNAKAWNNLCVVHNIKSEFSEAIEACRHAVSLDPGFQLAQNNLRWAEAQKQKAMDAIAVAEALPVGSRNSASYMSEGLDQLHVGNYDQALAIWQQLASREPANALAANNIGVAYMMKHDPAQAIPWFQKAQELDPGSEMAKNNLAWAHSER